MCSREERLDPSAPQPRILERLAERIRAARDYLPGALCDDAQRTEDLLSVALDPREPAFGAGQVRVVTRWSRSCSLAEYGREATGWWGDMRGPETNYTVVDGLEIAYQVIGDGPVDLVYHHGTCHLDLQWYVEAESRFNRRLASFSRLIPFDRRGTGVSQHLPEGHPPSWEEWTADLLGVMDAVGSEEATIFVENEATGPALLFAALHPDRVRSLVLHNGWARFAAAPDYPIGVSLEEIEAGASIAEAPGARPR